MKPKSEVVESVEPIRLPERVVEHLKSGIDLFSMQNAPHSFCKLDILGTFCENRQPFGTTNRKAVQTILRVRCKPTRMEGFPYINFADLCLYTQGSARVLLVRSKKGDLIWAHSCRPVYCDPAHGMGFSGNVKFINGWHTTRVWNITAWIEHRFANLPYFVKEELKKDILKASKEVPSNNKRNDTPWEF